MGGPRTLSWGTRVIQQGTLRWFRVNFKLSVTTKFVKFKKLTTALLEIRRDTSLLRKLTEMYYWFYCLSINIQEFSSIYPVPVGLLQQRCSYDAVLSAAVRDASLVLVVD